MGLSKTIRTNPTEMIRNVAPENPVLFFAPSVVQAMARRFIDREIVPHLHDWEKAGIVPRDVWLKAGAAGLLCSCVPEEYGGAGGDYGHSAVMIEELAPAMETVAS